MMRVGMIGTGNIAPQYVKGLRMFPNDVTFVTCADLNMERAQAFAQEHDLEANTVDELLARDDIDLIINLTIPVAHAQVSMQIIDTGKHVYSEKPLALTIEDGQAILDKATEKGVRVGCAPDTFLGSGQQTSRLLIDDGKIGTPSSAIAVMAGHGPESWHPNPSFFYQVGGGPLFDMAPYYLTALVNMLGAVKSVSSVSKRTYTERVAGHESIRGEVLPVEVETHIQANLTFESGALATMIMSFDIWQHSLPNIQIYGANGSLSVPDPNMFDGDVRSWTPEIGEWEDHDPQTRTGVMRGWGIVDMARCIAADTPHRASGALALHVLEIMEKILIASDSSETVTIDSHPDKPQALSPDY